ncbi:hypothetical protein B0H11DRAFT_1918435 [Mycena galericulata]|nr:hypothetical protein B0H11DRAFT_1918435 [Mycena galericulata]
MSIIVNGVLARTGIVSAVGCTVLSPDFAATLPPPRDGYHLVTVDSGPLGQLSMAIHCNIYPAAHSVTLGQDWVAYLHYCLNESGFRVDVSFDPLLFLLHPVHPLTPSFMNSSPAHAVSSINSTLHPPSHELFTFAEIPYLNSSKRLPLMFLRLRPRDSAAPRKISVDVHEPSRNLDYRMYSMVAVRITTLPLESVPRMPLNYTCDLVGSGSESRRPQRVPFKMPFAGTVMEVELVPKASGVPHSAPALYGVTLGFRDDCNESAACQHVLQETFLRQIADADVLEASGHFGRPALCTWGSAGNEHKAPTVVIGMKLPMDISSSIYDGEISTAGNRGILHMCYMFEGTVYGRLAHDQLN